MTDQQRSDWLGCYGHPVLNTPHIDSIANSGTRFTNFHVASPVCMPNRASFMTGRMPSLHGLRYNGCELPTTANTFIDVLSSAGYDTAAIGKSHLQPFTEDDPRHLPDADDSNPRIIEEAWKREAAHSAESPANYTSQERYEINTPYFGFSHVEMATRHGTNVGGHYEQWFKANVPDWKTLRDPSSELAHNYTCPQAFRTAVPEECYSTSWIADRAIDYIENQHANSNPFFAFVSFPDPHHPFNPPGKYWDMYSPADFDLPLPYTDHKNPPPPLQWMEDNYRNEGEQFTKQTAMRVGEDELRQAMALTAGMISMIDDQIGRVIDSLKANGLFDNTVIIFNSDHGDYLGDFGLLLKGSLPFRSITQVPMIWSDPSNREKRTTDAMCSTIDIGPSILSRAGLASYRGTQGRSFLKAMDGEEHRDELLIEFNEGQAKLGFTTPARVRTLRTRDWRFTIYADQTWGELYDLIKDPDETHNLWDDPDYQTVKGDFALRLSHHLTRQMDESPRSLRMA